MLFLAIQHLLTRKKQSTVTLLGILIGTTAFIVISSFFLGFQEYLVDALVSGDAHIKITARERIIDKGDVQKILFPGYENFNWWREPAGRRSSPAIDNPAGWLERMSHDSRVIAATPVYTTTALVNYDQTNYSLNITGMRASQQIKITNILAKMVSGNFLDLEKGTGRIVIGSELSSALAKQVGDTIVVTTPNGKQTPFKVVGIFTSGSRYTDLNGAYTGLADAQNLAGAAGRISQISVKVKNFREAADISNEWKTTSFDKVESWDQANENLMSVFDSQEIMRFMATGIIMLVAGFGIYNILNMVVTQKRKDIAILRSMGFEAPDVILLFLLQGLLLGLVGGLLGCIVGYIIGISLGTIHMGGPGARNGPGFEITFNLSVYLTGLLISNSAALAASFFPARSASRLTPIEIIRGAD